MAEDGGLAELKRVLRSLVVSSPTQVDVRALLRDYRALVGRPLPLRQYGYSEPDRFLREQCADCFVFQGAVNPVLTLIVPKQLKHIDTHVQRQKVTSTNKHKGKRRSIPETAIRTPQRTYEYAQTKSTSNNVVQSFLERKSKVTNSVPPEIPKKTAKECVDEDMSETNTISSGRESRHNHYSHSRLPSETSNKSFKSQSSLNIHPQESTKLKKNESSASSGCGSGSGGGGGGGGERQQELERLKREVRALIADSPDGLGLTDLMPLYRERYGRELSFSRVGMANVLSVVGALGPEVAVSLCAGGWRAALAGARPAPAPAPAATAPRPRPKPAAPAHRPWVKDDDDALPGIDFEPDVFPADCLHYLESVPRASIAGWAEGALLPVIVGEVYSPSHFWLIRLGRAYYDALDKLMDDMNEYYGRGEGGARRLALGAVRVGHHCAALYEGDWHRALVVRRLDEDTVKVRHVDWGTVERVPARQLRPLLRRFAALPAQCVRARLAHARPPAAARRWPLASCDRFLRVVRDTRLVAEVIAVDEEEEVVEVALVDTSTDEDVCVATELVRAGYADARDNPALRTGECYLHPSFEALETGATPNYAEIHGYLREGIALEFVEDYRRHVPTALPPAAAPPAPSPPPDRAPLPSPSLSCTSLPPPSRTSTPKSTSPSLPPAQTSPPPLPARLEIMNRVPLSPAAARPVAQTPARVKPQHEVAPQRARTAPRPPAGFAPPPGFAAPPPGFVLSPPYFEPMMYPVFPPFPFPQPPFAMGPPPMPPMSGPGPPPTRPSTAGPPGVELTASECEVFRLLSSVDAHAAQCYMLEAIARAQPRGGGGRGGGDGGGSGPLNPAAAEFCMRTTSS